ncbi:uncharacterized protein NECHADRAFT_37501 [Fusarium vanettenii 77-13-4]|uniref:Major facilitator superfamily (MFS) profile domain-containing protein n=1 Tax=Fusarium vanettenii (strain ATCC MYA-4622 / CBS 123669 / FGSC 9596 / NRRL 45880 / 77-13-4) TaxID=660122 RepID=C7ZLV0_FUSV7|nr:uncharacterized protein NECHADRAFT_37501 [Fusarium vanettenii 77-13-4]EEU35027.1 hypothetical protein NECHADRAFT_37501 [Fusarium vanettenii 77-13-4]
MEQVVRRVSPQSSFSSLTPPDGGWRAWCVCFSGHLVYMNTWGWVNSFGIFQAYYVDKLNRSVSEISWIGSISVFLLFFVGTLTGRLVDAGYFRYVFVTGILLQVVGVMVTSVGSEYWHFFVAQGVLVGLGHSCVFCPVLAVLSTYFARRRALAMGIAACGSATGGMVFPSLVRQLLPKLGFAWTLRIAGLTQLLTLSLALVFAKPRIKPRGSNPLVDWSAFKDVEYALYVTASFFTCWGVYLAYYFIPAYSQIALDPPLTYTESLDLLMILNGVGIVGRLASSWVADHTGAINVFAPHALAASLLLYFWMLVTDKAGLYAWAVIYGIIAAAIQSLFPTGVSLLTQDLSKIGVRMGMAFTVASFAALTGPPIAGAIIDVEGGYYGAQAFAGSVLAMGGGLLMIAKGKHMRRTGAGWMGKI